METKRLMFLAGVFCIFSIVVTGDSAFHSPSIDGQTHPSSSFNLTASIDGSLADPIVRYQDMDADEWNDCSLDAGTCTVSGLDQGIYEYYLINGTNQSTRFPVNGTLRFVVADPRTTYYDHALDLTKTDPRNEDFGDSCEPWSGDYSCAFEPYQAAMIDSFSYADRITDNESYREQANSTAITDYDEFDVYATCDRNDDDYDCENRTGDEPALAFIPASGHRQGAITSALTEASRRSNLSIAREEGIQYMQGHAENCDIWQGDYTCGTVDNQGRMLQAAWDTYLVTGNTTYYNKGEQLAAALFARRNNIGAGNYEAVDGLLTAFQMTENESYREAASDAIATVGTSCINTTGRSSCSIRTQTDAVQAMVTGYRSTGASYYAHYAEELLDTGFNGTCNPLNGTYQCETADRQGETATAFWQGYTNLPAMDPSFSMPRIYTNRTLGTDITFHIDVTGAPDTLEAAVRRFNGSEWTTCSIDRQTGNCTIDGSTFRQQTSYQYFFNTSADRFPEGYFTFVIGHQNETLEGYATNLTEDEPSTCGPWNEGFSCIYSHLQGWYITSMAKAHIYTANQTLIDHATTFAGTPYDPNNIGSFCDHADTDFDCDASFAPNGSVRQGKIIEALWQTYRHSNNETVKELAQNYSTGSPNDCDPWSGDYSCGSERGQGNMILGMLEAYTTTGNTSYLAHAKSLGQQATTTPTTARLLKGLWRLQGLADVSGILSKVTDQTLPVIRTCQGQTCEPETYATTIDTGLTAYQQTDNDTYHTASYETLDNSSVSGCDPRNGTYACDDAHEQGSMISMFWDAFNSFFSDVDGEVSVTADSTTLTPGGSTGIQCDVTNTVINGTDLVDVNVSISSTGLSLSGDTNDTFSAIEPEETVNLTVTGSSSSSGQYSVTCSAESENGWGDVSSTTITVEQEEQDDNNGGSGSDGSDNTDNGGGGGYIPPPEPQIIENETAYGFDHQAGDALRSQLGEYEEFNASLGAILETRAPEESVAFTAERNTCLSGKRTYRSDDTMTNMTLTLNYTCPAFLQRLVIYDRLPTTFATYSQTQIDTQMSQIVLDTTPAAIAFTSNNVTTGSSLSITYRTDTETSFSDFEPPLVIMKNHTLPAPPSPEITLPDLETNISTGYQDFTIDASEASSCSIDVNGQTVHSSFTPPLSTNMSFGEGWNAMTITCESEQGQQAIETFNIYRRPAQPDTSSEIPYLLIMALISLLLASGGIYRYKDPAATMVRKKLLAYRLRKMQERFQNDEFDKVITNYNKVKQLYENLHGHPPDMTFWNRYLGDIGLAMRVYLLLDLAVSQLEKGRTDTVTDTLSNLQRLYNRMQDDDNVENVEKVRKKAKELDKLLRMEGESFSY